MDNGPNDPNVELAQSSANAEVPAHEDDHILSECEPEVTLPPKTLGGLAYTIPDESL